MNIVLTESQYIKILGESVSNEVKEKIESSETLTRSIVQDLKKKFNLDFSFLLTWGAVLGGFIGPVSKYINGKYTELSTSDISLITMGVIMTYFFNNKKKLSGLLDLIKENGLVNEFDDALDKAQVLKDAFLEFMRSLGSLTSSIGNMLAYAFLIPILPTLVAMTQSGVSEAKVQFILKSLLGYVGVITSSTTLQKIIEKMLNRFSK
jgi:undecaprenyl pyrophosphate phosphatase UppP